MNIYSWLQLIFYMVVLLALAKPLGTFMAKVYQGEHTFLDPVLQPLERLIYRSAGVKADDEMGWKTYAVAMILFNMLGLFVVYGLQRLQGMLPLNPQALGAVSPDSSWNTAVSFATNTNWQGYGGETTMSYLTQMLGLAVQNFVSAATGMAVLAAMIRGLARHTAKTIGNFWVDLTRTTLYILLPLSLVVAVVLVSQGAVQTFNPYQTSDAFAAYGGCEWEDSDPTSPADGPGRFANRDQATGYQRGRLLQCQLGASIREPYAVLQSY